MGEYIDRQAAIAEMQEYWRSLNLRRKRIPLAAEAVYMDLMGVVATLPSVQRKGKWSEKKVIPIYENGFSLQSCKCSECGRYDTRPYMHYFSEPNFCSYCGAEMKGWEND